MGGYPGSCPLLLRVSPITDMGGCPFLLRTSIVTSTTGNLYLFLAQIRHTVGYLVIPTGTGLRSAKMSEQQTTRPRSRSNARISGYVIACNKMAWNGKHPLESASRSLLENFEFFAYACL